MFFLSFNAPQLEYFEKAVKMEVGVVMCCLRSMVDT